MKNKHITVLLISMAAVLVAMFLINSWIRENSKRQDSLKPQSSTTRQSK